LAALISIVAMTARAATAQAVSVTLNGTPLNLTPAPQERAGRIFVPLRGIFEQLGASVVYANGTINAQGNGRSVSLHIGSTQATVNGQPQALDVAPFVIGASTYVPLRFVSQALGAGVNYDAANKIVAISNGSNPGPAAPAASRLRLGRTRPDRDADVASQRPTIEAHFIGGAADPNSLRITLDGLDITEQTSRSPSGFVFSPPSDLQSMRHDVRVTGTDRSGAPFALRWSFRSGTSAALNTLQVENPVDGATVDREFTVSGQTAPGALVDVAAGTTRQDDGGGIGGAVGSILGLGGGASVNNEITADADGRFATTVRLDAPSGTPVQIVVSSTDPRTKAGAPSVKRRVTIR
jgi:hypothetical protein